MNYNEAYEIYVFCKDEWERLIKRDGGYSPSSHDDEVLTTAAKKFKTTPEQINDIYQKISYPIEVALAKKMSKEDIEKELIRIIESNLDLKKQN